MLEPENIKQQEKQKIYQQKEVDFERQICEVPAQNIQSQSYFKGINQIDISQKFVLIATHSGLFQSFLKSQYQNSTKKIVDGQVWDVSILPKTNYAAYCLNNTSQNKQLRKNLFIFNLKQNKIAARIKIESQIQFIKCTKFCISLVSLETIYVLHFPSLKPIFNGPAGNGVNIIFDLSYEGFTIAHNSFLKGQLIVRNFTNIQKSNAIQQRKKSIYTSKFKGQNRKQSQDLSKVQFQSEEEQIQPLIKINAHKDMITKIKLSPNGNKVASASNKGTVLRIFSTKNGSKLQEFRIGYEIVKIVDISFVPDGNILGCMSSKGNIKLFNVSMSGQQKQYENQRLGHSIYTQSNPKSFFSFLSFAYPPFGDSFSFNHFQLINPQFNEESQGQTIHYQDIKQFTRSESFNSNRKSLLKEQLKNRNHSILELDEEHHQDLSEGNFEAERLSVNRKQSSLISQESGKKQIKQSSYPEKGQQIELNIPQTRSLSIKKNSASYSKQIKKDNGELSSNRPYSSQSESNRPQLNRINSTLEKRGSLISSVISKNENKKAFQRPLYNMISKLHITQANYVWAIKGYHIFGLKYDAFHGGQMILDHIKKIQ